MFNINRAKQNPLIVPNPKVPWQANGAFNPSVVKGKDNFHLLFRAQSIKKEHFGQQLSLSTIGYCTSKDGIGFGEQRQLIKPEENWEKFGCEDPRLTKLGDTYYVFYTALSNYPFTAQGIRIGVALTKDFSSISERHLVTHFNSKAMALFPEKVGQKYVAILTVDTDCPPAKIAIAYFDDISQIWSEPYWEQWKSTLSQHVIPLLNSLDDHLEVGAAPVWTKHGWLLIYSYIQNYFSQKDRIFGINAVLLDLKNPQRIIGKITEPLFAPHEKYELQGQVPNVIFPSSAYLDDDRLSIYYGAADTTCCLATLNSKQLLARLTAKPKVVFSCGKCIIHGFERYNQNPIITPRPELAWESKATFNPAAIYEDGKVHIVYRAMSADGTSVFGYGSSRDGVTIDERLLNPIYEPREHFEQKMRPGFSGCEDPRITRLGDRVYLFYTAFDGYTPRVAFTSILLQDFINHQWNWQKPLVITPPGIPDKDACLLSKKINGKYVIFHRAEDYIHINFIDSLEFGKDQYLEYEGYVIKPRKQYWDNRKFGIASPPLETKHGWLLFFHRVAIPGIYKIEALLLSLHNPTEVIAETNATLLEPELDYEIRGEVPNVVFPCGNVLLDDQIYLYYGGADKVVAVARMNLDGVLKRLNIWEGADD